MINEEGVAELFLISSVEDCINFHNSQTALLVLRGGTQGKSHRKFAAGTYESMRIKSAKSDGQLTDIDFTRLIKTTKIW